MYHYRQTIDSSLTGLPPTDLHPDTAQAVHWYAYRQPHRYLRQRCFYTHAECPNMKQLTEQGWQRHGQVLVHYEAIDEAVGAGTGRWPAARQEVTT